MAAQIVNKPNSQYTESTLNNMSAMSSIPNILTFLHRANQLKTIIRYKSSLSKNGDTVADHSLRLALMVFVIGGELQIPVNISHAMKLALLHDLAELETDDVDAVDVIKKKVKLEDKQKNEAAAMKHIVKDISFGGEIFALWNEYEKQQTLEAKFVKALDKIEAFLHLDETGTSVYIPKEFYADYADAAVNSFDIASKHFPPLKGILDPIKTELKRKFEENGVMWVEKTA
ncbi:MAG: hypothetical protein A3G08_04330 [Candidatus Magasanikbacteria bacterium RIFCSPLOWO2_12_FULL_47_9b]|nr:MAG: hypothetical protein A3G08_04330 [Candidatus Magasanikbacteria bacterium RIFCSPLOWO2_12_FULL_47_9b]